MTTTQYKAQVQDCEVHDNFRTYYGQLIGVTITNVVLVGDEWGHPTPVLLGTDINGRKLQIELWSDPEGNGSGHADISEA